MAHAKILPESVRKSQLEVREAVTPKTNRKSIPEAYRARTTRHKRKRSPTNNCKLQGTKTVKQLATRPVMSESRRRKYVMFILPRIVYVMKTEVIDQV